MQLATQTKTFRSKNIVNKKSYEVASTPHMMKVLSDFIYSDKIGAVLRELGTNAFESHMRAGHNKPFTLNLPTYRSPKFRLRDYGTGLSLEDIDSMYRIYGLSDKSDSNEFTGCFGVGSKSPYAYTDSFTTISYQDGTKHIIENTKDEDDCPSCVVLGSYPTDEPNGVEIFFDIKEGDKYVFEKKATEIYQWFKVKPDCNTDLRYTDKIPSVFSDDNWEYTEKNNFYLIMGQVKYPLDIDQFDTSFIKRGGVTIHTEIGSVDVNAGRESLQYTKRTKEYLKSVIGKIEKHVTGKITEKVKSCKNLYDARILKYSITKGSFRHFNINQVTFKNQDCSFDVKLTETVEGYYADTSSSWRRRNSSTKCKSSVEVNTVSLDDSSKRFVIKDKVRGHVSDCKYLVNDVSIDKVYLIDEDKVDTFCTDMGFDKSYLIKCSSIDRPKCTDVRQKISAAYEFKMTGHIEHSRYSWDAITIDLNEEGGVYIPIREWSSCHFSLSKLRELFKNLPEEYKPERILGVLKNRTKLYKESDNWESISDFVNRIIKDYAKYKEDYTGYRIHNALPFMSKLAKQTHKIEAFLPKYSEIDLTARKLYSILIDMGAAGFDVYTEKEKVLNQIYLKYPLLRHINPSAEISEVLHYINSKG